MGDTVVLGILVATSCIDPDADGGGLGAPVLSSHADACNTSICGYFACETNFRDLPESKVVTHVGGTLRRVCFASAFADKFLHACKTE